MIDQLFLVSALKRNKYLIYLSTLYNTIILMDMIYAFNYRVLIIMSCTYDQAESPLPVGKSSCLSNYSQPLLFLCFSFSACLECFTSRNYSPHSYQNFVDGMCCSIDLTIVLLFCPPPYFRCGCLS